MFLRETLNTIIYGKLVKKTNDSIYERIMSFKLFMSFYTSLQIFNFSVRVVGLPDITCKTTEGEYKTTYSVRVHVYICVCVVVRVRSHVCERSCVCSSVTCKTKK